jgi:hypothetical protein
MEANTSTARTARKRSTTAVTSGLNLDYCWWNFTVTPDQPSVLQTLTGNPVRSASRRRIGRKTLRFPVEWVERFPWLKYFIVAFTALAVGWFPWVLNSARQAMNGEVDLKSMLKPWQDEPSIAAQIDTACAQPVPPSELRRLAALCLESDPSLARRCFHTLEQRNQATEEDRCAHAALLARLHDFTGARAVLGGKPPTSGKVTPLLQATWIRLWTESGDFVSAAGALESITHCGLPEADLALDTARFAVQAQAPIDIVARLEDRAVAILDSALAAGAEAHLGLRVDQLLTLPLRLSAQRKQAAALLSRLTQPSVEQRLGLVSLRFPADPSPQEREVKRTAIRSTLANCGALTIAQKNDVASFLLLQNEPTLVLELISRIEANTDRTLFNRRVTAVLTNGDWKEAGRMAAAPDAHPVPWARTLMAATASLHASGEARLTAESLLTSAISEALLEKRWASAFTAARMALDHKLPSLATRAFDAALRLAPDKAPMLKSITETARRHRASVNVVRLAAIDSLRENDDPEVQVQLAYLDALVGSHRELEWSDAPEGRLVRAFQHFQKNELHHALAQLVPLPRHRWHQGQTAVIASILAAGGNLKSARPLLGQIDPELLFPEEHAIVQPWVTGSALGLGLTGLASEGSTPAE